MTGLSYFRACNPVRPLTVKGQRIVRVLRHDRKPDIHNEQFRQLPIMDRDKVTEMWLMIHTDHSFEDVNTSSVQQTSPSRLMCQPDLESK